MAFVITENCEKSISSWNGKWISFTELLERYPEVWEEIARKKNISVNVLKKAIPHSIIGKSDIRKLIINNEQFCAFTENRTYRTSLNYINSQKLFIKKERDRFYVRDSKNNTLFSYFSFQSKYDIEGEFGIHIFEAENLPYKFVAMTDIDKNTEGSVSSSFHVCFANNLSELMKFGNIHTFMTDDGFLSELLKKLFLY